MRFLLDTNLVEHGWRYRLGSEDHEPASLDVLEGSGQERLASDLRVLDTLFMRAQRTGSLEFIVAPESLRELADSTDPGAAEVLTWAQDLATYMAPEGWPDQGVSLRQSPVLADFVRPGDAVLICETNRLGCAGLLTCDYRLVRQKARIKRVAGVDVLTPSDVESGRASKA